MTKKKFSGKQLKIATVLTLIQVGIVVYYIWVQSTDNVRPTGTLIRHQSQFRDRNNIITTSKDWHNKADSRRIVKHSSKDSNLYQLTNTGVNIVQDTFKNDEELQYSNIVTDRYYDHRVTIKPNGVCTEAEPLIVAFVHSRAFDPTTRDIIRQTWANVTVYNHTSMRVIFTVGREMNDGRQNLILKEADQYGDLLQCDFVDTYRNLTRKQLCAMKWILENCPETDMIVKVDDDAFVNVYRLIAFYHVYHSAISREKDQVYCHVLPHHKPLRKSLFRKDKKWMVSYEEYAKDHYPPYCAGFAHIMSPSAARRIFDAAKNSPLFWIDDVFITGMLRLKANVSITNFDNAAGFGGVFKNNNFFRSLVDLGRLVNQNMFINDLQRNIFDRLELWSKLTNIFKQLYDDEESY